MKNNKDSQSESIFFSLLAVLFIGLKLTGHINWSWLWVLSPLWGPLSVVVIIFAIVLALSWFKDLKDRKKYSKRKI